MDWQPIETAPEGDCLMWVIGAGERRAGRAMFGRVLVFSDGERVYKPDSTTGNWPVTHWMPVPGPPTT